MVFDRRWRKSLLFLNDKAANTQKPPIFWKAEQLARSTDDDDDDADDDAEAVEMSGINRRAWVSQAFTIETGGLGGESVDRAGGGFLIQTAQLDLTKIFTGHQRGNMEVLSVLNLGDFAQIFSKMGMFPVFDLAYYIVSILYLKYEPGELTPSVCL